MLFFLCFTGLKVGVGVLRHISAPRRPQTDGRIYQGGEQDTVENL